MTTPTEPKLVSNERLRDASAKITSKYAAVFSALANEPDLLVYIHLFCGGCFIKGHYKLSRLRQLVSFVEDCVSEECKTDFEI